MESITWLTNNFLIAMPSMADPNFTHTVTLICDHDAENGAIGLVFNRTLDLSEAELMDQIEIDTSKMKNPGERVFEGGPVQVERGFILHSRTGDETEPWESSLLVSDELALTTSQDILRAIAQGEGPEHHLIALGYAGWGPGQLEYEISENAWLHATADPKIIFDTPVDQRWQHAALLMGVDINAMGMTAGHA